MKTTFPHRQPSESADAAVIESDGDPRQSDIDAILSHRWDNGGEDWTTPDGRFVKGAPFAMLESPFYLLELGVSPDDPILQSVATRLLQAWRPDGRIKTAPSGGLYPCHTALALNLLCRLGYAQDPRMERSFQYFLSTQEADGGWKCNKYSFGHGPETQHSTPYTTLVALDAFRQSLHRSEPRLNQAVDFLLNHWRTRAPISPCHYGIGSRFMQVEYPFRGYGLFYYVYVLSFYECARLDARFLEAFFALRGKLRDNEMPVERVVPKLGKLYFCRKGFPSSQATGRYQEIVANLQARPAGSP